MPVTWVCLAAVLAVQCGGCAAVQELKDRQATRAEASVPATAEQVLAAALAALPRFALIATARYSEGGTIEARGDWGSTNEGAIVQVYARAEEGSTRIVVEAAASEFDSRARKRELARALLAEIQRLLSSPDRAP